MKDPENMTKHELVQELYRLSGEKRIEIDVQKLTGIINKVHPDPLKNMEIALAITREVNQWLSVS